MKNESRGEPEIKTKKAVKAEPALHELFLDSLRDIYWAENHLVKTLPGIIAFATSQDLNSALQEHLILTEKQIKRLEQIFDTLGEKAVARKCDAMEGLTKEGEHIVERTEAGSATRDAGIILAVQKIEHYEIATYGGLTQLAKTLGLDDIAEVLAQTLSEEKDADFLLTEIAENCVNYKASEED
ncbi:ferritin-like domain-containing protein [Dyadobacter flavalbus]|uniref:Ferritin-like domain-containing protein n=1 Tax=Dyadobacter flavalbus TaxID=2579942 RepID=A0A5M8QH80_9BACT|nr:ferritin-like domain-containing protein [Dyadobacter flavalbus]KAA6434106.1 ferritin-like domain-containing protein [Dyadobacter flavalbus]